MAAINALMEIDNDLVDHRVVVEELEIEFLESSNFGLELVAMALEMVELIQGSRC